MLILVSNNNNERKVAIVSKTYSLVFKAISGTDDKKPKCALDLIPREDIREHRFRRLSKHEIYGFLGFYEIDGLIFLAVITGRAKVAQPTPNETVNKIYAVDFFCVNDDTWDEISDDPPIRNPSLNENPDHEVEVPEIPKHPCHDLRKLLSNGSFYYSTDFDLTSSLQYRQFSEHSLSIDRFEKEFMWNYFLMDEIISYRDRLNSFDKQILDDEGFLTTVIRGFAESFVTYIEHLKVSLTIIAKQNWKRAGTRYNVRGIDDDSNVANFVETEFILYSSEYCFSTVQIRGSVPVFWEQEGSLLNPKLQIMRSMEATQPIFDKHFEKLIETYGSVHIINLLSSSPSELELTKRYKDHLKQSKIEDLHTNVLITCFDFHKEAAQEGFSAVGKLLPLIKESTNKFGYFLYDVKEKRLLSTQAGVFRTNCLDCLDRTNLAQQAISLSIFKLFLNEHRITRNKTHEGLEYISTLNSLWADHGDQISQIYTGTNALKSSFTRKGKMSLKGTISDMTKSVSRRYINSFKDKNKQQNIDALLGRLPNQKTVKIYNPINDYIKSELLKLKDEYTTNSQIKLFVGTFNVNGNNRKADLSEWLFPIGDKFKPDVVLLGLQEVIELTAGSLLNADYSKGAFWETMVKDCLNQYTEKYVLLRVEQVTSLIILMFVRSDKLHNVKKVEGTSKKTGFKGMAGNKGAVAISFDYGVTSFCFVNVHLAAGVSNIEERHNDYREISKSLVFQRSKKIDDHDRIFWLGDLNYRIDLPNEDVRRELLQKNDGYLSRLIQHDQLSKEVETGSVLHDFKEPTLNFHPTYKYDYGKDSYDSSEKGRTPSWTDRIIYKGVGLQPLAYSDSNLKISDHKPVYAAYKADVVFIDEKAKRELEKQIYWQYQQLHPDTESQYSIGSEGVLQEKSIRETISSQTSSMAEERGKEGDQKKDEVPPPLPSRASSRQSTVATPPRPLPTPPLPRMTKSPVSTPDDESIIIIDNHSTEYEVKPKNVPLPPPVRISKNAISTPSLISMNTDAFRDSGDRPRKKEKPKAPPKAPELSKIKI